MPPGVDPLAADAADGVLVPGAQCGLGEGLDLAPLDAGPAQLLSHHGHKKQGIRRPRPDTDFGIAGHTTFSDFACKHPACRLATGRAKIRGFPLRPNGNGPKPLKRDRERPLWRRPR